MPQEVYNEYLKGYDHKDKTIVVWGVVGVLLREEYHEPPELLYCGTKNQALDFIDMQGPDNAKSLFLIKMYKKVRKEG